MTISFQQIRPLFLFNLNPCHPFLPPHFLFPPHLFVSRRCTWYHIIITIIWESFFITFSHSLFLFLSLHFASFNNSELSSTIFIHLFLSIFPVHHTLTLTLTFTLILSLSLHEFEHEFEHEHLGSLYRSISWPRDILPCIQTSTMEGEIILTQVKHCIITHPFPYLSLPFLLFPSLSGL